MYSNYLTSVYFQFYIMLGMNNLANVRVVKTGPLITPQEKLTFMHPALCAFQTRLGSCMQRVSTETSRGMPYIVP